MHVLSSGVEDLRTPKRRSIHPRLNALLLGLTAIAMVAEGFPGMFNRFQTYDDEGLYLLQVREAAERHGPYSHIYTQYGPLLDIVVWIISSITRIPLDHDGGRAISLLLWVAVAFLAGVFVYRQTKSTILGVVSVILAFLWMQAVVNEPGQPAPIGFILTLLILILVQRSGPWLRENALGIGALCVGLAFLKVNLGIYALAAVGFSIVATTPSPLWLRRLVAISAVALPFVILHHGILQGSTSVMMLLVIVELGVFALSWCVGAKSGDQRVAWRWLYVGGAVALIISVAGGVYQGDGLRALLRAVLLHAVTYASATGNLDTAMTAPLLLSLGTLAAMIIGRYRQWRWLRISARAVVIIVVFASVFRTHGQTIPLVLPAASWAVVPVLLMDESDEGRRTLPRLCLTALIVFNELQVFPIAGSQLSFATLLPSMGAMIVAADLVDDLRSLDVRPRLARSLPVASLTLLMLAAAAVFGPAVAKQWERYQQNVQLHLPGSTLIRLSAAEASALEATVRSVDIRSCTSLITVPGMLSFYAWTDLPPPRGLVISDSLAWQRPSQRENVKNHLLRATNVCLVSNVLDIFFWDGLQLPPPWPRFGQILNEYRTASTATGDNYFVSQKPK